MAGRQRAAGAGRAGRHGEPRTVQLVQHGLPVDIETREGDDARQAPLRVPDHLHVRHQRRHPRPDPLRQFPQPRRLPGGLRPHTARSDAAAATIAGRFSKPGARPDSRSSRGPWGANRTPLRTTSSPTPEGPPPCGRSPPAATSRPPPDPSPATGPRPPAAAPPRPARLGRLGHRLKGAHLVVGGLETGQRGVRPQRPGELARAYGARAVHRHLGDRAAAGPVNLRRMEYRGVFDS